MKLFSKFILIFFVLSLSATHDEMIFDREIGKFNPDFIQNLSVVTKLHFLNQPEEFINNFPPELLPKENESFEHNRLMEILPLALKSHTMQSKNALLSFFLKKKYNNILSNKSDPFWIVALIHAGADPNYIISQGSMYLFPLAHAMAKQPHLTTEKGLEYLKTLLKLKADPNKYYLSSDSYEYVLDITKRVEFAELLIMNGAQLNPQRLYLHYIALDNASQVELLSYFIKKHNCDVNENAFCGTPLHNIVKYGSLRDNAENILSKTQVLLDNGADIDVIQDVSGFAVIDYIEERAVPELLQDFRMDLWTDLKNLILKHKIYIEETKRLSRIITE